MKEDSDILFGGLNFPQLLSASAIKLIAVLTMLIDHIGAVIVSKYYYYSIDYMALNKSYSIMRGIGRTAFPLFCFFVAEGLAHTSQKRKYILRLGIFALVSEPFFDYAFSGNWLDGTQQNVMFTILLGVLGLTLYDLILEKLSKCGMNSTISVITAHIPVLAMCALGFLLKTDYSFYGVLAISMMYLHRGNRIIAFLAGVSILVLGYGSVQIPGFLAVIPVLFYNGQKGKGLKYFFYVFYPAHLLILAVLAMHLQAYWNTIL